MFLKPPFLNDVSTSTIIAYIHYLAIILGFGALMFERLLLKQHLSKNETISIIIADVIYGIAALAIEITGIVRVKYYGLGGEFYISNPIFLDQSFSIYPCRSNISLSYNYLYFMGNSSYQE